jgi:hypothetical protein
MVQNHKLKSTVVFVVSGKVGITLCGEWYEPVDNETVNVAARDRALQFMVR